MDDSWQALRERWQRRNPAPISLPAPVRTGVRVFLCERDPERLSASLFAAAAAGARVALANPDWSRGDWDRAISAVLPDVVLGEGGSCEVRGDDATAGEREAADAWGEPGSVLIPTGGTGGLIRFARHTPATLMAAARAVCDRLEVERYDALCVLPLHHVGGLMQVFRALYGAGSVRFTDWRELLGGGWRRCDSTGKCTSLVPTQLSRALADSSMLPWLRDFRAILVGGGAMADATLEAARAARLPLAPCYGMTESAAAVTLLTPEAFLAGGSGCGRALPHAAVGIVDAAGAPARTGHPGRIVLRADSLCAGYVPGDPLEHSDGFVTGDRGSLDENGSLHVLGRVDFAINTGGELVFPETVERALLELDGVADAVVVGVPDLEWGERVVALVLPEDAGRCRFDRLMQGLRSRLAPHQRPKEIRIVSELPRNAMGKPDRARLAQSHAAHRSSR